MDFQTFGDAKFKNENVFSMAFARVFIRVLKRKEDTFSERMKEIIRDMEEARGTVQVKTPKAKSACA